MSLRESGLAADSCLPVFLGRIGDGYGSRRWGRRCLEGLSGVLREGGVSCERGLVALGLAGFGAPHFWTERLMSSLLDKN